MFGVGINVQVEAQLNEVPIIYFVSGDVVGVWGDCCVDSSLALRVCWWSSRIYPGLGGSLSGLVLGLVLGKVTDSLG